jgi:UDP-glucose 4-epimerase
MSLAKFSKALFDLAKTGDWQNEFKGIDWVAHLAALADIVPSIENPESYFHSNVTGTLNVLQASNSQGTYCRTRRGSKN